jgi:hypothetical protein
VPERPDNSVYVLGRVNNPGLYQLEDSVTVWAPLPGRAVVPTGLISSES